MAKTIKIDIEDQKQCLSCLKWKKRKTNYFKSYNQWHKDGLIPYCKNCLKDSLDEDNIATVVNVLRVIDKPYNPEMWQKSKMDKKDTFGVYLKNINFNNKYDTYADSVFDEKDNQSFKDKREDVEMNEMISKVSSNIKNLKLKWGNKYEDDDLIQLEKLYEDMDNANDITTPQHKSQLKLICKLEIEQNKALEEGRINDFKGINMQYNKTLENSGFRPIDKQDGGESIGIRTFSQIWEEIERDGFIKPSPIKENQDIVDSTILYTSNYVRKLLNMESMTSVPDDAPKSEKVDKNE